MSITPVTPAENSRGKVKTWVKSQWKFRPKVGQFSVQLNTDLLTCAQRLRYEGFLRREADNAVIRHAASAGMSIKQIVRRTGHSRKVVRDVVRGGRTDIFRVRASSLEPYLLRRDADWVAGCHNGAELYRRLRSIGYRGSPRVVAEWTTRRRRVEAAETQTPIAPPSARSMARLMTAARDQISPSDAVMVALIEKAAPKLVAARDLFDRFQNMIRSKASAALAGWIEDAVASLLATFAKGIVLTNRLSQRQSQSPGQTDKPKARSQNSR